MVEVAALRVSPGAASMRCRTNLKKDKRIRNRVNAFRFKKAGAFLCPRGSKGTGLVLDLTRAAPLTLGSSFPFRPRWAEEGRL